MTAPAMSQFAVIQPAYAAEDLSSEVGVNLEAEGSAGLPQFDPAVFAPQVVWLIITFAIFYFLMSRLVLPRIGDVIEDREERIADDLDQAQQLSEDAASVQDTFEGSLSEARTQSFDRINEARAKAQAQIDAALAKIDQNLAAQADASEERIAAERAEALKELESVATDVSQDIMKKLVGSSFDKRTVSKAVRDQISSRNA